MREPNRCQIKPGLTKSVLRVRNRELLLIPFARLYRARKRRDVASLRLIEHIETVPERLVALLLGVRCNGQVGAADAEQRITVVVDHERLIRDVCRILALVGDVVSFEAAVRHLRIKVSREAERGGGVDAIDGALGREFPRVDRVRVG